MASSTDRRNTSTRQRMLRDSGRAPVATVEMPRPGQQLTVSARVAAVDPRVKVAAEVLVGLQERRRRRRVAVPPMYTQAVVRVLSTKGPPLEGHLLDLSENGMRVDLDSRIAVGQAVTVEFRVAGMGRIVEGEWSQFVAAAVVVRENEEGDLPGGPYQLGLRFVRISTMAQGQIARFVATQPG
jgi:c-di-GMP-binding flagellar brake protein YcgR